MIPDKTLHDLWDKWLSDGRYRAESLNLVDYARAIEFLAYDHATAVAAAFGGLLWIIAGLIAGMFE